MLAATACNEPTMEVLEEQPNSGNEQRVDHVKNKRADASITSDFKMVLGADGMDKSLMRKKTRSFIVLDLTEEEPCKTVQRRYVLRRRQRPSTTRWRTWASTGTRSRLARARRCL